MRIGIDVDDTLAKTEEYMLPYLIEHDKNNLRGTGIIYPNNKYYAKFDWTKDEILEFLNLKFDSLIEDIPPYESASSVLQQLKSAGHEIIIITSRDDLTVPSAKERTMKWLEKNNLPYDKVVVDAQKKNEDCLQEKIDLFIDDSIGQCSFVANHNSIPVLLMGTDETEFENIISVRDWQDVLEYLKELKWI